MNPVVPRAPRPWSSMLLCLAAFACLVSGLCQEPKPAPAGLEPGEVRRLLAEKKDVVALDVRTATEFSGGHLPGATNIDSRAADFRDQLSKLDRSKTYVVHCARGLERTTRTVGTLKELGFEHVIALKGGYNAWDKAGLPVEKPAPSPADKPDAK